MKKLLIVLSFILILQTVCVSCSNIENNNAYTELNTGTSGISTTNANDAGIKEIYNSNNRLSIFEKELKRYNDDSLKTVLIKFDAADWTVDGKRYKSMPILMELNNKFASWKIDLSKFAPVAKYKDIIIFSPNETHFNSVLVAVYGNNEYFLVCDDILKPEQYTIDDFAIEVYKNIKAPDLSVDSITKLWKQHLSAEHDLSKVILEEEPYCIRLRLKNNPELIYTFSYIYYDTYYCTPLPYKEGF